MDLLIAYHSGHFHNFLKMYQHVSNSFLLGSKQSQHTSLNTSQRSSNTIQLTQVCLTTLKRFDMVRQTHLTSSTFANLGNLGPRFFWTNDTYGDSKNTNSMVTNGCHEYCFTLWSLHDLSRASPPALVPALFLPAWHWLRFGLLALVACLVCLHRLQFCCWLY